MRRSERNALRALYHYRCAYCGTTEVDTGGELTVDHFQPRARGGADVPSNGVYACITCNDYKGDYWHPDAVNRILHPLHDHLADHIHEGEDGRLVSLTATGQFHIERLQLNRPQLVTQRRRNRELQALHQRLTHLEEENALLRRHLRVVEEQIRLLMDETEF
jgi:hypothetical protein